MNRLYLFDDSTQWVWNVHISLEWWTLVYNNEESIDNCSRKECQENHLWIKQLIVGAHNLVVQLLL